MNQLTTYRMAIKVTINDTVIRTSKYNLTAAGIQAHKDKIRQGLPMGSLVDFKVTQIDH